MGEASTGIPPIPQLWDRHYWIPTSTLTVFLLPPHRRTMTQRQVAGGDWDLNVARIDGERMRIQKLPMCLARWRDGLPWEETGIFDVAAERIARDGSFDRCHTLDEVEARCRRLDAVYQQVVKEGRLRPAVEVDGWHEKPRNIRIHIGRDGRPIWGRDGAHRYAMAVAAELPAIPIEVLAVHADADLADSPLMVENLWAERGDLVAPR